MRILLKAAIRILAIIAILILLNHLVTPLFSLIYSYEYQREILPIILAQIGILILFCGIIIYLSWWRTDWITKLLAGNINENETLPEIQNIDLYRILISALGVYFIIDSISNIVGQCTWQIYYSQHFSSLDLSDQTAYTVRIITINSLKTILGVILIFGGARLKNILYNFWNFGTPRRTTDGKE